MAYHVHVFSCMMVESHEIVHMWTVHHLGTILLITVTSQWARRCLKSPASRLFTQPFIQVQIKEHIKAPRHWPLRREFTGVR